MDLVNYPYPWLEAGFIEDNIRISSKKDIAAMKLAAITGRGSKKDFIDIYFLFRSFTLREMIGFYNQKYSEASEFVVLKSLTYFEDAEEDEEPKMLVPLKWNDVKETIRANVTDYLS